VRRLALLAALALAACGSEPAALPPACADAPDAVVRALASAPGTVRLEDGTLLSECVSRARDDAELQQLGYSLTPAADRLAARGTTTAALQLGFLVGAVRHAASRTNGVHAELVRKLEGTMTFHDPALVAAARRGLAAGEAHG
jgi:hypothetical protein